MTFLYPTFLWALTAISIPVIIHLFNFRKYQKVYFTNVRFLRELQQESKSRSRLREILVLICRCLCITALVLAFAEPAIKKDNASPVAGATAVSIFIDNSFSMENVGKQGPLFQMAKNQAKDIVKAFGNADRFQIITNDFEGRHQRLNTKEDALRLIEELKISSVDRSSSDVLARQLDFISQSSSLKKRIFMVSDAQRSTFDIAAFKPDTTIPVTILPIPANQTNNLHIDSCWFETPLQQKGFIQNLHAKITNTGGADLEVGSARLAINNKQVAIASFSLPAGGSTDVKFTFESKYEGFNFGSVKIEDYPVTFDDELFFTFNSRVRLNVALINGQNVATAAAFRSLFESDSLFQVKVFSDQTIDYNAFKTADVIVLNQPAGLSTGLTSELIKFSSKGGAIVFIPGEQVNEYRDGFLSLGLPTLGTLDTTTLKTEKIEFASGFFSGVFEKVESRVNLPQVKKHFKLLQHTRSDLEPILSLQNGDAFLSSRKLNNATVYLFSAPLEESAGNFSKHALFVPTFYQISFKSQLSVPLFYTAGSNVAIHLKSESVPTEEPPHIKDLKNNQEIIPEVRNMNHAQVLFTRGQLREPGFYNITRKQEPLLPLAFNYSRKESPLTFYSAADLQNEIGQHLWKGVTVMESQDGSIDSADLLESEGKKLWKLFLFLALLFIALEVLLLRFLK